MKHKVVIMFAGLWVVSILSCSNEKADRRELDAFLSDTNLKIWVVHGERDTTNVPSRQTLAKLFSPTNRTSVNSGGNYSPGVIIIFSGTNYPRGIYYQGDRTFVYKHYRFRVQHTNEIIAFLDEPAAPSNEP
jgi:hypothetical protein